MSADAAMPKTREQLAAHFSGPAIRRRRLFWTIVVLFWAAMLVLQVRSGRLGWVLLLSGVNCGMALLSALEVWRSRPRTPEMFGDREIIEAERTSTRCPRCSCRVLEVDSRCARCGSVTVNLVMTPSGVGVILLITSLTIIGFALWGQVFLM